MNNEDNENLKRTVEDVEEEENGVQRKKLKHVDSHSTKDSQTSSENNESKQSLPTEDKPTEDDKDVQVEQNGSIEMGKINFNKKKKCVLLLSYCGSGYSGMQRNPGVATIEEDLTNALLKANVITEDVSRNYGKMSFQRCARTDKGVSAARQVVSLKYMVPAKELLPEINKHLKPQIRVFALKRVTRGFNCKTRCTSRTYEYLMPTLAFAQSFAYTAPNFRISDDIRRRINEVLSMYKGTQNFHNFTSGRSFTDESSKRYMKELNISGEPFVEKDVEFIVLQIEGQSFMQHQIRKMIGLLIAIIRNCTGTDAIERSFEEPKMDIPKAPGLGLILDQVHFDGYNKKFGKDKFHDPLVWHDCEDEIDKFKKKFIYSNIIETEIKTKSMLRWLNTLSSHSYSSTGMEKPMSDRSSVDEEEPTGKQDSSSCVAQLLTQEEQMMEMEGVKDETRETGSMEEMMGGSEVKESNQFEEAVDMDETKGKSDQKGSNEIEETGDMEETEETKGAEESKQMKETGSMEEVEKRSKEI